MRGAEACRIPVEQLTPAQALRLEPELNPQLKGAFHVPDGTFDPLRLALAFAATAKANRARFLIYTEVEDLMRDDHGNVVGVRLWNRADNLRYALDANIVVNATGAWAGALARLAGAEVMIKPTAGIMLAFD